MANALVPLANGFEDIEALTIIDVLRRGGVQVVVASMQKTLQVMSASGIEMKADALFADVAQELYDAIVLPGGGEGTENLKNSTPLLQRLGEQRASGRLIAAICAAPTVLAEAGLLDENQHATCYPSCQMDLPCPWIDESVVSHDGIITGQAPGCAMLFAIVVLQTLVGEHLTQKVARSLVFEP